MKVKKDKLSIRMWHFYQLIFLFQLCQSVGFTVILLFISLLIVSSFLPDALISYTKWVTSTPLSSPNLCLHFCVPLSFFFLSVVKSNTECNILQFKTSIIYLLHSDRCRCDFGNEKHVGKSLKGITVGTGSLLTWQHLNKKLRDKKCISFELTNVSFSFNSLPFPIIERILSLSLFGSVCFLEF